MNNHCVLLHELFQLGLDMVVSLPPAIVTLTQFAVQ